MLKKLIAGAVTAAVLATGSLAVAGAVGNTGSSTTPSTSSAPHAKHRAARLARGMAQVAAKTIGVSVADLRAAVKSGHTVASVATAHHVAPQTVVDAIVQAADQRIDAALKAGKLTTSRAAKLKARAPKIADLFVNHTPALAHRMRVLGHRAGVLDTVAGIIGVSPTELRADLAKGQSIADVATAHNVSVASLDQQLVTDATQRIEAAVKAGKLTATQAKHLEANLPARIDKLVHRHFKVAGGATTPGA